MPGRYTRRGRHPITREQAFYIRPASLPIYWRPRYLFAASAFGDFCASIQLVVRASSISNGGAPPTVGFSADGSNSKGAARGGE
jgi:hypothetical protein